jgi:hypothetical protein
MKEASACLDYEAWRKTGGDKNRVRSVYGRVRLFFRLEREHR